MKNLKSDAQKIITTAIESVHPEILLDRALAKTKIDGEIVIVAIGKAAWEMAKASYKRLQKRVKAGIVITKYSHSKGKIGNLEIYETGHPLPDKNSILATKRALQIVKNLSSKDTVLFLCSGGGSSLFEIPNKKISLPELIKINDILIKSGANINEINCVRKHLSQVKGGRFALACHPSKVVSLILSDVVGDSPDVIASAPAFASKTRSDDAKEIFLKYKIPLTKNILKSLEDETPKYVKNVQTIILGNGVIAAESAVKKAQSLGYKTQLLTTALECDVEEAARMFTDIAKKIRGDNSYLNRPYAFVAVGETVVKVVGKGKGGRNQELALRTAFDLQGLENCLFASVGTDGTDGPTDAAGGIVDGESIKRFEELGIDASSELKNNNSYFALDKIDALIKTGPTGTNVNDLILLLVR